MILFLIIIFVIIFALIILISNALVWVTAAVISTTAAEHRACFSCIKISISKLF